MKQKKDHFFIARAARTLTSVRRVSVLLVMVLTMTAQTAWGMQIFVKPLTGPIISIEVEQTESIESTKAKIQEKLSVPSDEQALFCNNKLLLEGKTLSDYNLQKESMIYLAPLTIGSIGIKETLGAYEINSVANLNDLAVYVNGTGTYSDNTTTETTAHNCEGYVFKMTADITFSYEGLGETESNYTAIGNSSHYFSGTFDGDGHTISGIRIYGDGDQGFFGMHDGMVKNVLLANSNIRGSVAGGIVAKNSGYVDNCHVLTGVTITGTGTLSVSVGGVVGQNNLGAIVSYCTSAASIGISANSNIGGIAGSNAGSLTNNLAVGVRTTSTTSTCNRGAIVGMNEDAGSIGSLGNNFYSGCAIGKLTSNVGCNSADVTVNNGAVPISDGYIVTVGSNVTADIFHKIYGEISPYYKYAADENVTLNAPSGYSITSASYNDGSDHEITVVNGVCGFIMPACNITVTATRSVIDWATANEGTKNDPYIIYNKDQLDLLATNVNGGNAYNGKYFVLANDITYTHTTNWDDATSTENNYTPIGCKKSSNSYHFRGTFDGNGHTVSGIRIYKSGTDSSADGYLGLFGCVFKGTVKNVTVSDMRITGYNYVGGIMGRFDVDNNSLTIENCHATATVALHAVNNHSAEFGGIVGYAYNLTINGCTSAVTITASGTHTTSQDFGGIAGCISGENGRIINCLAVGVTIPAIHCTDSYNSFDASGAIAGGFNGSAERSLQNYYHGCILDGTPTESGIGFGWDYDSDVRHDVAKNNVAMPGTLNTLTLGENITAHGALINQSGTISVVEGSTVRLSYSGAGNNQIAVFSLNGTELVGNSFIMPSADASVSASLVTAWGIDGGANGSEQNPYVISRSAELDLLATNVNNGNGYSGMYFLLANDIAYNPAAIDANGDNYTAIGTSPHPFRGTFDGQGHTISGIRINQANNNYQGLFGYVYGGTVKNVTLSDARITGSNYVGGIVGSGGTIENCLVIGTTVTCNSNGGIIVSSGTTLRHNYYSDCTKNNSDYDIGTSNGDRYDDDEAVSAVILSETQTSMPTFSEYDKVVFRRSFTKDVASTVCLPFDIDATQAAAAGNFYTFVGVDKTNPNDWIVTMQEADPTADPPVAGNVASTLSANTPYLFKPAATGPVLFYGLAAATATAGTTTDTEGWEFTGTYEKKTWASGQTRLYGFAAADYEKSDGSLLNDVGAFRRFNWGYTDAFRCYLWAPAPNAARGVNEAGNALPESLRVILVAADGTTTDIGTMDLRTGNVTFDGDAWYSLDGRRLNGKPTKKGMYIHNGKTVVIKN